MVQVQVRMPEKEVRALDEWVREGRFESRSDAIKSIVSLYEEREKTRAFLEMLEQRSREAKKHPERLVKLK
jgi:Arc/MetJ-type ribon-helix-helix transcriptional regulator